MINQKHLLAVTVIFLAFDVIIGLALFFFNTAIVFFDWLSVSFFSLIAYFFFYFLLLTLFKSDMRWTFSKIVIVLLIGTFLGIIGCIIKLFDNSVYLLGLIVFVPIFTNAIIWEYFPKFYLNEE